MTLAALRRLARCAASERCIREALKKKGIKFRRLRSKPPRTRKDKKSRYLFSKKYRHKTKAWWRKMIDLHIDLKLFQVYCNAAARDYAAKREVRGAYRGLGEGLEDCYVVQPKSLRYNTGAKPCRIAAGMGRGRVHLWQEIKGKWTGQAAADLYAGPLLQALKRARPRSRTFTILEDNDPTGFKSKKGVRAKAANKIKVFAIPKRSPDLSVCDYALWKQVNAVMRRQEARFHRSKRETRAQFIERLKRAARGLTATFINKSIGDMVWRCKRCYEAQGGHFEEGGRKPKAARHV